MDHPHVAHVTALLSIGDGGETDAQKAKDSIQSSQPVTVANPTVAAEVLRFFGCSEEYITERINYAIFGSADGERIG